ncbi:MAG: hypothetical protein IJD57_02425 [Candidatus Gastranaerophilales bacterium]|nr:hypothetical protein [Candidatus Gastranaerophilales bacterium]
MEPSLNVLKQPEPNIVSNNATTTKRETLRPNVGVVDVPAISSPTTTDILELKRQENPHTVYKLSEKPKTDLKFQGFCSIGIALGSLISLISLFKKTK